VTNTKARHIEILNAAARVVEEAGGVEQIDALDQEKRRAVLLGMAKVVKEQTQCHISTAKRNIAKALRRARYKIVKERAVEEAEAEWGGQRPGAGPPEGNQNQNWEEKREGACTCRPKVVNGKNLYLGAQEVYGCLIHCTHYGVADGGICLCGQNVRK
jgi:hypothetical protein